MAKQPGVWAIDIGQCGLKALRCMPHKDEGYIKAEAFDYIEYPKILSQPEAVPSELIHDALEQFLSRNDVRGDKVAISVPGQNGLARFIKLPPVESKKIPDIVKYEARQQIPFPLDEVIWDYQQMPGGSEEDGFVLETEVGLFAMKREQVDKVLKPFTEAGIEVDLVQLTPLALYNYVVFDQMADLPPPEDYDPDNPPDSVVVLSVGTDTTDLVVTNGYRVWQRSVPIGGSHFTKALTKDLKQTFAKSEHIKRNATQAENPKAIFQAMRPVFTEMATEVQRSLNFFTNMHKKTKISKVYALGNALKLPGLQRFLSQNLKLKVDKVETFRGLRGSAVVDAPAFQENILAFGACYGLALQLLADTPIRTNLVPPEVIVDRIIREKKPWAVGAAAALLLALTFSYAGHWRAWRSVHDELHSAAESKADNFHNIATKHSDDLNTAKGEYFAIADIGKHLLRPLERRNRWNEMVTAIEEIIPKGKFEDGTNNTAIYITSTTCERVNNLKSWYDSNERWHLEGVEEPGGAGADPDNPDAAGDPAADPAMDPAADPAMDPAMDPAADPNADPNAAGGGLSGPGWVFTLEGHHYHNSMDQASDTGAAYVRNTIIQNLLESKELKKLGAGYPILVDPQPVKRDFQLRNPNFDPKNPDKEPEYLARPRFDLIIQFCWKDPLAGLPEGMDSGAGDAGAAEEIMP